MYNPSTTILIFSRKAKTESKVKKLHNSNQKNEQLHQALYNHTIATVQATGLPYFIINEEQQFGNTFAQKYCNAIEYCFEKGVQQLITIGSDCATLTVHDLLQAANTITVNTITIAPNTRGGFYLLALHHKNYQRNHFLQFHWCKSTLVHCICNYYTGLKYVSIITLATKADIHSSNDIYNIINVCNALSSLIVHILFQLTHYSAYRYSNHFNIAFAHYSRRGPPCL